MQSLLSDSAMTYNKLCKTYIKWKRQLNHHITKYEKLGKVIKDIKNLGWLKERRLTILELRIKNEGNEVPYFSGPLKLLMTMNNQKLAVLETFDEQLQDFHERKYAYANRGDHYMISVNFYTSF